MLGKKEKAILEVFLENKDKFITSKNIANKLIVSDKTIRTYIKRLQPILLENGSTIVSKQGNGYKLNINCKIKFDIFLRKNIYNNSLKIEELKLDESKDRQYYILNKLFFEKTYVLFDDLSEELFVSRSTLSNDFSEIRKILKIYKLHIVSKTNKGVYIDGDEINKRYFIMNYFFGENFITSINKYIDDTVFFNEISSEELIRIILDECKIAKLKLSDYIIQNLVLYIALAIKRNKDGFKLSNVKIDEMTNCKNELIVAKRILDRTTLYNCIEFSKEEVNYIALTLMANSVFNKSQTNSRLVKEIKDILVNIEEDTGYPMADDKQLINGLVSHFDTFLMRLKYKIYLINPMIDSIKDKYNLYLEFTKKYLKDMPILKDFIISDNEWAYICLHFMAAIQRYKENKKIKVLIVCSTGYGSSQMLKARIDKEFKQNIDVVGIAGYYELDDKNLKDIDLIISSIDLSTSIFNIPVIQSSVFLNDEEINKIKDFIEKKLEFNYESDFYNNKVLSIEKKELLINKFFNEDCFTIIKEEVTNEDVVKNLISLLQKYEDDNYSNIMIEQVTQREYLSSTAFSDEIVVPHPAKSVSDKSRIAVAIIPDGLKWNKKLTNIKFVFLLSTSKFDNKGLNKITQAIVKMVDDQLLKKQLLECKNFYDFKSKFIKLI